MVGKLLAKDGPFLEYIRSLLDIYAKMVQNPSERPPDNPTERPTITVPYQTKPYLVVKFSLRSNLPTVRARGHGARQAIFATSENALLQRFPTLGHKIIHNQPFGRFSALTRSSQRALSYKLNCDGANRRSFAVKD